MKEYNLKVSETFNIDIAELDALWEEFSGMKVSVRRKPKKEDGGAEESKSVESSGCPYVFSKGDKSGTTCGVKVKIEGRLYCSKHKQCEEGGQPEKKAKASPKPAVADKKRVVIRMNKEIEKYWNPETKLVFKSKEEKVVIGSFKDGEIKELTPEDIETCLKIGFKFETAQAAKEEAEEEEVEEEVDEEVEEEVEEEEEVEDDE